MHTVVVSIKKNTSHNKYSLERIMSRSVAKERVMEFFKHLISVCIPSWKPLMETER